MAVRRRARRLKRAAYRIGDRLRGKSERERGTVIRLEVEKT
jgi:hypothetical protein